MVLTHDCTLSQGFHNWDQCSQTMMRSSTTADPVSESRANQPAWRRALWTMLQTLHHAETFTLLWYEYKRSNTELQHQCWASFCIPTAAPCSSMLQRQGEHKAGDGRVTNLVFLSRNTWHNSPRVTQELNGYKEKSCCYNNSTEKGNSLWVVLSLRLKETFISSLTVTIQRNYSCGCSCRMLLLLLKNGVIVPGCTTEG